MKMLKGVVAALIAVAGTGSAWAAGQSPGYLGVDVGAQTNGQEGAITRAYAGYTLGSSLAFDLEQVHALELMVYTQRKDDYRYAIGDAARVTGVGVNWTTALKLNNRWSLNSRLGASGDGVTAGLGMAYRLAPHVSLTLDFTYMPLRLNTDARTTTPTLGTGLRYNF